jgi:electron transfer flavoprotein alpha subunit
LDNAITIIVVVENDHRGIKPVTYELLNAARKLAENVKIIALYFTDLENIDNSSLIHWGANEMRLCTHSLYHQYTHETYAAGLQNEIEKIQPDIVLMSASNSGKELLASVATRLGVVLASDCIELKRSEDGEVTIKRPIFSGKAYSLCKLSGPKPYLITLRPNIFRGERAYKSRTGETLKVKISLPDFLNFKISREVGTELDITEARIIVSGGLGMQAPENFKLLKELAEVLGAAVAASRPVVDNGWQKYTHQVGQTGRTVSPDLYIACGISGAVQHLAGMSSSRCIVAINSDPNAAIFSVAHYGIVGDVLEVVPLLTQEFKRILES